ncbi:MAG TPA: TOBE domain-containing protein, partial [Gammaproteobacteria bacterium]
KSTLLARITRRSAAQLQLATGLIVWAQIKSAAILA